MNKFSLVLIGLLGLILISQACVKNGDQKMIYLSDNYSNLPYRIYKPTKKFVLKNRLREISGLSYNGANTLLCINDEQGIVYKYNHKKKEISQAYKFDKSGDYEGVELVDSLAYVIRSDGRLFIVDHLKKKDHHSKRIKTFLNANNNVEGLAYDSSNHSLLLACKGNPSVNRRFKGKRAIYEFSIDENKLMENPKYLIDLEQIRNILEYDAYSSFSVKLLELINPAEGDVTFQPSAVAIHPLTKNLYVLGSVGKLLIVLSPKSEILAIVKLKRKTFRQPEGICFTPDGTMFISNEGKGGKATILKFKMRQ